MIDYSENLKKGNLESLKLVSFLIEMSDSIANYVDLLDTSENVS